MIRQTALSLIVTLACGTIFPLQARQVRSARMFDPALGEAVYTPLQGLAGVEGTTVAGINRGLQTEWAEAAAAPAEERSTTALVAGGLAGGVAGLFVGGVIGAKSVGLTGCTAGCDESALYLALLGAAVGETLSLPLGVHLTNRRQGSYLPAMLASVALTGTGIWIAFSLPETPAGDKGRSITMITVPVLQLVSSIQIERQTARQ
jgi:hypothetical protein